MFFDLAESASFPTVLVAVCAIAIGLAMLRRATAPLDVPVLTHSCNPKIAKLLPRLCTLKQGYRPPLLHPTGLLQSRLANVSAPAPAVKGFVYEKIELPALDRPATTACCPTQVPPGIVSISWLHQPDDDAPICLLIPGLTGDSSTPYVRRAAFALHEAGLRVGCFNPRGRGGNPLLSPFLYSAGYTEDLRRVVRHVRAGYPYASVSAAGYSLGASYLAKYVGEEGGECELTSAVCFACPTALRACVRQLGESLARRLIDRYALVPSVQRVMHQYLPVLRTAAGLDLEGASRATSMEDFDGCTIAPMMGCSSAEQYYREASSERVLARVRVPMLFLSARNDPIAPAGAIKTEAFSAHADAPLLLAVTAEGGHSMLWAEGFRGLGRAWSVAVLLEWLQEVNAATVSDAPFITIGDVLGQVGGAERVAIRAHARVRIACTHVAKRVSDQGRGMVTVGL